MFPNEEIWWKLCTNTPWHFARNIDSLWRRKRKSFSMRKAFREWTRTKFAPPVKQWGQCARWAYLPSTASASTLRRKNSMRSWWASRQGRRSWPPGRKTWSCWGIRWLPSSFAPRWAQPERKLNDPLTFTLMPRCFGASLPCCSFSLPWWTRWDGGSSPSSTCWRLRGTRCWRPGWRPWRRRSSPCRRSLEASGIVWSPGSRNASW